MSNNNKRWKMSTAYLWLSSASCILFFWSLYCDSFLSADRICFGTKAMNKKKLGAIRAVPTQMDFARRMKSDDRKLLLSHRLLSLYLIGDTSAPPCGLPFTEKTKLQVKKIQNKYFVIIFSNKQEWKFPIST